MKRIIDGTDDIEKLVFHPTARDSDVWFRDRRHYIPVVRNLSLQAGKYKDLKIHFRKTGSIVLNETEFSMTIESEDVKYERFFTVEAGKITSLHAVPQREYREHRGEREKELRDTESKSIKTRRGDNRDREEPEHIHHPDRRHKRNKQHKYHVHLKIKSIGESHHLPVEKIFVRMLKIEAVDINGNRTLLNEKESEFELLTLRDGAVALMGNNMVPEGEYACFEITLGDNNRVEIAGEEKPLIVEFENQSTFRFEGPFPLRGGRITEVFLHFDPNSSIFYLPERGFILDPTVMTTSAISMTAEQDLRLIEALGARSNLVASEAELIFQGKVKELANIVTQNIHGGNMIYSDMILSVEDRLRGTIENPENFPLRVIGGEVNGMRLRVTGMPEFKTNERFLIFLKAYGDRYGVVRGEMGKISL